MNVPLLPIPREVVSAALDLWERRPALPTRKRPAPGLDRLDWVLGTLLPNWEKLPPSRQHAAFVFWRMECARVQLLELLIFRLCMWHSLGPGARPVRHTKGDVS
jgi:hypothetical protein